MICLETTNTYYLCLGEWSNALAHSFFHLRGEFWGNGCHAPETRHWTPVRTLVNVKGGADAGKVFLLGGFKENEP